jgi:predicted nucleic acid-binding protein
VTVVSNTSPITNLAAIGQISILRQMYGTLYIPEAVYRELREGEHRGDHPPFLETADWIQVRPVPSEALQSLAPYRLDRGEAEAIALAHHMQADLLLMDERIGRRCARERNLRVVGVLGTLVAAKQRGIIAAVRPLLEQLRHQAGFYVSDQLLAEVLQHAGE